MHDFHEADRISKIILDKIEKNKLTKLINIEIELGQVIEHGEDILPANLDFNLRLILEKFMDKNTKISIKKVIGDSWKLVSIEGN
jgi:Zn finger protein HypA/HybF involved in hydrogenase expression